VEKIAVAFNFGRSIKLWKITSHYHTKGMVITRKIRRIIVWVGTAFWAARRWHVLSWKINNALKNRFQPRARNEFPERLHHHAAGRPIIYIQKQNEWLLLLLLFSTQKVPTPSETCLGGESIKNRPAATDPTTAPIVEIIMIKFNRIPSALWKFPGRQPDLININLSSSREQEHLLTLGFR
jgi:hypothetical protein